jgi:hypothetical protein
MLVKSVWFKMCPSGGHLAKRKWIEQHHLPVALRSKICISSLILYIIRHVLFVIHTIQKNFTVSFLM